MRLLFCLTMLLGGLCGAAQVIYQPGYLVFTPGDTLRGEIGVVNWNMPFDEFYFKEEGFPLRKLKPNMVENIVVPGWEMFLRVKMDKEFVFLKQLVASDGICLYKNEFYSPAYFFTTPANRRSVNQLEELPDEANDYRIYLSARLSAWDNFVAYDTCSVRPAKEVRQRQCEKARSIVELVMLYNTLQGHHSEITYRRRRPYIDMVVSAGVAAYHPRMNGAAPFLGNLDFRRATLATLGLSVEKTDPWFLPRLSIGAALVYSQLTMAAVGSNQSSLSYHQKLLNLLAFGTYNVTSLFGGNAQLRATAKLGMFMSWVSGQHAVANGKAVEGLINGASNDWIAGGGIGILWPAAHTEFAVERLVTGNLAVNAGYHVSQSFLGVALHYHLNISH